MATFTLFSYMKPSKPEWNQFFAVMRCVRSGFLRHLSRSAEKFIQMHISLHGPSEKALETTASTVVGF